MALNEPAKYLNFNCGTIRKVSEYFNVTPDAIIRNSFTSVLPSLGPMPDLRPKARKRIREAQDKFGRIGEDGEDFVVRMERKKLKGTEYAKGINANFANDPSKGFDVFSFTRDGLPLYIEVKATVGRWNEEFYLSENEYQFLEYCLEKGMRYELHRVYNLKSKGGPKVKVYTAEEVFKLHFKATEYRVSFKGVEK